MIMPWYFENSFEGKKGLVRDTIVLGIFIFSKRMEALKLPFPKDFSYILELHLEDICEKLVKLLALENSGTIL
jgi:hypothetical protein